MYVFLGIIGFLVIVIYSIYVGLIKKKNQAFEAFSGIDVQLKKRHDLIPNILIIAKKFMKHEKDLLTEITGLRSQAQKASKSKAPKDIEKRFALESQIDSKMGSFFVSVENYPDLKSDKSMLHAQTTYNEVEEHIAASRRFYNSAVTQLNNAVEIFPGSFVASIIGVKAMAFFKASELEKKSVNAADIL